MEGMNNVIGNYKEVIIRGKSISDDPNIIYYETFSDNPNKEDYSKYFSIQ